MSEFELVNDKLHELFGIKDLGSLKFFLGLEVVQSNSSIFLCQRKYWLDMLSGTTMMGCKSASTPMDASLRLQ